MWLPCALGKKPGLVGGKLKALGELPHGCLPGWVDAERGLRPRLQRCPEEPLVLPQGAPAWHSPGAGWKQCHLMPKPCWETANTLHGLRSPSPSKKETSSPGTWSPAHTFKRGLLAQRWMPGTGVCLPQEELDRLLTRLMQGAVTTSNLPPKSGLCWHQRCWRLRCPSRAVAPQRLSSPRPAAAARPTATLLPQPAERPAWPEPHITGRPKSHRPCQEQTAGAKHPVIGERKASSAGGPAGVPLPAQHLQPKGAVTFLP